MMKMKTVRSSIFACVLLITVLLVSCTENWTVKSEEENEPHAAWNLVTVTGEIVNLRSGPGTIYAIIGQVQEGDSLQVTGGLDDWYRVYIPRKSLFAWIYGPLTSGTELP